MSNFHPSGSGNGSSENNSNLSASRREARASSNTGAMPVLGRAQSYVSGSTSSSFDFEAMLVSLHDLFEHDRQIASQSDATRCGICYLYFKVSELHYRDEEGFYVCSGCEHVLSKQKIPMLRYQQK